MSDIKIAPLVDREPRKRTVRIKYNEGEGFYEVSSYGEPVAILSVDENQLFKLRVGDYSDIQPHFSDEQIYVYAEVNLNQHTPNGQYLLGVTKPSTHNELGYGAYSISYDSRHGVIVKPYVNINLEKNLIQNNKLKNGILEFFANAETGRKKKEGILLFGAPGNGKTTDIMSLFDIAVEQQLRVFIVDKEIDLCGSTLRLMKEILQNDKNIFILEEVTQRTRQGTEDLLTFLDGEHSWANCVTIATTNYPEDLPANLVDRPGRFATFIEYKNPTVDEITQVAAMFGFTAEDAECLMKKDLSFDYVSYILSESKKSGKPVAEVKKIQEDKRKKLSQTFKGKIGIY